MRKIILYGLVLLAMGVAIWCFVGLHDHPKAQVRDIRYYFTSAKVRALINAAEQGDTQKVDDLVNAGVNVNTYGSEGVTPLLWVSLHQPFNMRGFKALLDHGANPNVDPFSGKYAIGSVTLLSACLKSPDVLQYVLAHGGSPNLISSHWYGRTPLFMAAQCGRIKQVRLLLQDGADVGVIPQLGDSALLTSIKQQNLEIAELLLRSGSNYKGILIDNLKEVIRPLACISRGYVRHSQAKYIKSVISLTAATSLGLDPIRDEVKSFYPEEDLYCEHSEEDARALQNKKLDTMAGVAVYYKNLYEPE